MRVLDRLAMGVACVMAVALMLLVLLLGYTFWGQGFVLVSFCLMGMVTLVCLMVQVVDFFAERRERR